MEILENFVGALMAEASFSRRIGWVLREVFSAGHSQWDLIHDHATRLPARPMRAAAVSDSPRGGVMDAGSGSGAGGEGPVVGLKTISQNFKLVFCGFLALLVLFVILAVVLELAKADASNLWTLSASTLAGLVGLVVGKASN